MAENPQFFEYKSLSEFKNNLELSSLDTSTDNFFKENIDIKVTKEEFEQLKINLKSDNAKKLDILREFIKSNSFIEKETVKDKNTLKTTIDTILASFEIKSIKKTVEVINEIQDPQEKALMTNYMLGELENRGYNIYLKGDQVEVSSTKNGKVPPLDMQRSLNTLIQNKELDINNVKNAILYRTSNLNNFVESKTDTKGNLVDKPLDAEVYYNNLLKTYKLDSTFGPSIDDIKANTRINQKDRVFMISYLQGSYKDFPIDQSIKQFREDKEEKVKKVDKNMPEPAKQAWDRVDNRGINEKIGDFLRDPFKELNTIMGKSGIAGLAILGSIIYFMFKEPKKIFGGIAIWGLLKGVGVMDGIGRTFDGDYNEDIANGGRATKEWLKTKLKEQNILGYKNEVLERGKMWYSFNNFHYKNGDTQKEIIDSDFSDLYNSSKGNDFGKNIIRSDGKAITPEEKKRCDVSLKGEIDKLVNIGTSKNGGKKEVFLENIKGMTVLQVIKYVTDKKKETSKPDTQSNEKKVDKKKVEEGKIAEKIEEPKQSTATVENKIPLKEKTKSIVDLGIISHNTELFNYTLGRDEFMSLNAKQFLAISGSYEYYLVEILGVGNFIVRMNKEIPKEKLAILKISTNYTEENNGDLIRLSEAHNDFKNIEFQGSGILFDDNITTEVADKIGLTRKFNETKALYK